MAKKSIVQESLKTWTIDFILLKKGGEYGSPRCMRGER